MAAAADTYEKSLKNILDQKSLKWIFVGGKGGVGKTTTSSSLAVALSQQRQSVLLISTDPAHNLSDAFGQKFGKEATKVQGFDNLSCMEIDPTVEIDSGDALQGAGGNRVMSELVSAIPGIDEAMSFSELMKQVQKMDFDVIVFDTAPTGHTLRLLSFPSVLEKAFHKLQEMRERFSGLFSQVETLVRSNNGPSEEQVMSKLENAQRIIQDVNAQFQDATRTTFVCVCIPEFLSLYETERLIQELAKFGIDSHNIVVNHVLVPEKGSQCKKCNARVKMQQKYLQQIDDLYEDFNVTVVPLLDEEVRGRDALNEFARLISTPAAQPDMSHLREAI